MDTDSFVCSVKEIPQRAANLYVDGALSPANMAFATASLSDAQLFATLARAADWCLGEFNVQHLANTTWAYATASQSDAQLFATLARAVELHLGDFNM